MLCRDVSQHRCYRIGGKFGAVKCGSGKPAKGSRKRLRRKRAGLSQGAALDLLGEERSARDRSGAAAAQKARFRDTIAVDAHGELQNVTAHRIAHFHFGVGAGKVAGIARILKVIENGVAEHQQEYSNAAFIFSEADIFCR